MNMFMLVMIFFVFIFVVFFLIPLGPSDNTVIKFTSPQTTCDGSDSSCSIKSIMSGISIPPIFYMVPVGIIVIVILGSIIRVKTDSLRSKNTSSHKSYGNTNSSGDRRYAR